MTVALRSPQLVGALIPVDNAPVDANLKSDFHKYVQGMRDIEEAQVKRQAEADELLQKHEEVSRPSLIPACFQQSLTSAGSADSAISSHQFCTVFARTTSTASYPYQDPRFESRQDGRFSFQ